MSSMVFIHGWGTHGKVWGDWLSDFPRARAVDLPGHGRRPRRERMGSLHAIAEAYARELEAPAVWVGWSLGGQVAMRAALDFPEKVSALVLVCATPRFVAAEDWPQGMPVDVYHPFAEGLERDHEATLERFAALEVHGSDTARRDLPVIRRRMHRYPAPACRTLRDGLALLERTDLRPELARIEMPALLIGGRRDRLVSPRAVEAAAGLLPNARVEIMSGAGHAPFLGHPVSFTRLLREFIEDPHHDATAA